MSGFARLQSCGISRSLLGMLLAAVISGCGQESRQRAFTVRDSAGIAIVESRLPRWTTDDAWSVDPEPTTDLAATGSGAAHEFFRVRDAIRLADGTFAVANSGSSEVRLFSETGQFVGSVGRRGDGPGEFQFLADLARYRGDSLIAFDRGLGRVTILSAGLDVSRTISMLLIQEVHPLGDGSFAAVTEWPSVKMYEGEGGLIRRPVPVARVLPSGETVDTVLMSAGNEEVMVMGEYGASGVLPLFGRESHIAVHQSRIYVGSADRMQFEVYTSEGQLRRIVRVPNYELWLSPAEVQNEREARLGGRAGRSPLIQHMVSRLPNPEARPACSDLLIDSAGFVWVAEFHGWSERDEATDWEVFNPDGEWLGSVELPSRFSVHDIGSDYVLGVRLDDQDVEHVQVLSLRRN